MRYRLALDVLGKTCQTLFILLVLNGPANAQVFFGTTQAGGGPTGGGTIFKVNTDGTARTTLYNFIIDNAPGIPGYNTQMIKLTNGKLYGVAGAGGVFSGGVLYEYDPVTNTFTSKLDFEKVGRGNAPSGGVVEAPNGKLYGITNAGGGLSDKGVLYEFDPSSGAYAIKIVFSGTINGANPQGGLSIAPNGKAYGTTASGGANNKGTLFEFDPGAGTLVKKVDFDGISKGEQPTRTLTLGANGKFYGTTELGGASAGGGVLFEFDPGTGAFTKMFDFSSSTSGSFPRSSLVLGSNNHLYGTAGGGANGFGTLFEFDPATGPSGTFTKRFDFDGASHGAFPYSLIFHPNGMIYGGTEQGGLHDNGVIYEFDPVSYGVVNKYDFDRTTDTGGSPVGGMVIANDNKIYGTTFFGAAVGVMYSFDPATGSVIRKLDFNYSANGNNPSNFLLQAPNGKVYGTTGAGGTNFGGVLFEFDPVTVLPTVKVMFDNASVKGRSPFGRMALIGNKIYGTTNSGGTSDSGTIFEYDLSTGSFTKKIDINGTTMGKNPNGLVPGPDGKLYGQTLSGAVFDYNPGTNTYTKRADTGSSFALANNMVLAPNNKFYGTTMFGGVNFAGILFEFDPSNGNLTKKYDFGGANGVGPTGTMTFAPNGKLYGLTNQGGTDLRGVLFEYTPGDATIVKKVDFTGPNGSRPFSDLALGAAGKLYGVTTEGGLLEQGIIFQFDPTSGVLTKMNDFFGIDGGWPGPGPLAIVTIPPPSITSFSPSSGIVGTTVTLTGSNFHTTPASNIVKFNGTAAVVTASSSTSITTSVPSGAMSGTITVEVIGQIATSSNSFSVVEPLTISSFTPTSGPVGTTVTITGTRFGTSPESNIVFFGATRAVVSAATTTQLTVTVPIGATYEPISVTSNGATAFSRLSFAQTFQAAESLALSSFAPKVKFITGGLARSVTLSDLDGDGKPDITVVNGASNSISILKNTSSPGTISGSSFAPRVDLQTGSNAFNLSVEDIDADGKPDLATTHTDANKVSIFKNSTTGSTITIGSFGSRLDISGANSPRGIALADLDADGKTDIVASNVPDSPPNGGSLSLFKNVGSQGVISLATFGASSDEIIFSRPDKIAIGDLDGDGKPDLVSASLGSSNLIRIHQNVGPPGGLDAASFAPEVDLTAGFGSYAPVIGDIDGDGKPDIVVVNRDANTFTVFRNLCTPGVIDANSFTYQHTQATSAKPFGLALGDLDGDGKPEVVVANFSSDKISVHKNMSIPAPGITGITFLARFDLDDSEPGILNQPVTVAVGDVDGDGKPDIVASNNSSSVTVFRNQLAGGLFISGFNPASGPVGSSVTISGTNFDQNSSGNTIKFNGTSATVTSGSATSLVTTVPAGAATGPITVTASGITATSATNFTVTTITGDLATVPTEMNIFLFPNPAKSEIVIGLEALSQNVPVQISIFDTSGKLIEQRQGYGGENLFLDVRNYSPNLYLIRATQRQKTYSKSFVKE